MRRGVVSVPDPRLRRRTVKTLPEELRGAGSSGAQLASGSASDSR